VDRRLGVLVRKVAEELAELAKGQVSATYCYRASKLIQKHDPNISGKAVALIARKVVKALERMGISAYIRRTSYISICIVKRKALNNTVHG